MVVSFDFLYEVGGANSFGLSSLNSCFLFRIGSVTK